MWHPKKNLDPFLPVFSHFFMSYFDILGSIFEKCAMTDLPNVIVSMCLASYNFCMIPHVCSLTFGLNLSGAWGGLNIVDVSHLFLFLSIKWRTAVSREMEKQWSCWHKQSIWRLYLSSWYHPSLSLLHAHKIHRV